MDGIIAILPLLIGWTLDLLIGDPQRLPHPIVWFGKCIAALEHRFNRGAHRKAKGAVCAVALIAGVFGLAYALIAFITNVYVKVAVESILIFYCLASTTLIREVRGVFKAVDESLQRGREQVGRIVGRDTSNLSAQEIRTAALETLSENLSDGVIAPLFWYALLGVPGMLAYKMVNTLDSMIGYRNDRYRDFGCWAARIDDVANYLPARITAFLMVLVSGKLRLWSFVRKYASMHLSPNSGYPESALAGVLNCRFGGPHDYFGESVYKPYIGENDREITTADMVIAVAINRRVECVCVLAILAIRYLIWQL